MRYLSVCSGVEAASVAWEHLGWTPVGFSEIEPFPSAVLKHRFPNVPNFGDMTKYKEWPIEPGTVDVLVGGTPCQSFSVAGLRKGLDDPRGSLMLTFLGLAEHLRVPWLVWENVPGVLSSNGGRDFGSFLGALGQLGFRWAYRVLDAKHFGVPQRRRRVFVVAHFGDGGDPAKVLFEPESLRGDSAKSGKKRQSPSRGARPGAESGGRVGPAYDGGDVAQTLTTRDHKGPSCGRDGVVGNPVVVTATGPVTHAVSAGSRQGTASVAVAFAQNTRDEVRLIGGDGQTVGALAAQPGMKQTTYLATAIPILEAGKRVGVSQTDPRAGIGIGQEGDPMYTLQASAQHAVATVTGSHWDDPANPHPTLNRGGIGGIAASNQELFSQRGGGLVPAQPIPMVNMQGSKSNAVAQEDGPSYTLNAMHGHDVHAIVAPTLTAANDPSRSPQSSEVTQQVAAILSAQPTMAVRRLLPIECEFLQGFPANWTLIPWKGKPASECPDGPRYKAMGNSFAVPVVRWIGERLDRVMRGDS